MDCYSNRIANYFSTELKFKKGDCVALFMENQPEYVGIWLGLSKLGVITALVNTNLRNQQLVDSINVAKAKYVIFNSNLGDAIKSIENDLNIEIAVHIENKQDLNQFKNFTILNSVLNNVSDERFKPTEQINGEGMYTLICVKNIDLNNYFISLFSDTMLYIYTSGTTGLPKPGIIKQSRYTGAGFVFFESAGLTKEDRIYVSLPIYHGNGCFIGIGSAIICGATVSKFSKYIYFSF